MSKVAKIVTICLIIWALAVWANYGYIMWHHQEKPMQSGSVIYTVSSVELDQKTAVEIVNNHFHFWWASIEFCDMQGKASGQAIFLLNKIKIEQTLSGWDTLKTLTHEYCHLKYNTNNETFTEYMTFVEMYESDNVTLHQRARYMIMEKCMYHESQDTAYDCSAYIYDYCKKHKIF